MESGFDILVTVLGICLALIFVIIFAVKFFVNVYMPFIDERDYIRGELMRSHGNERVHWEHEMQRLYMSTIPLIGGLLVRRSKQRGKKQRERR